MKIQSKKTKVYQDMSLEEWEMLAGHQKRKYTIIDASDTDLASVEITVERIPLVDDDLAEKKLTEDKNEVEEERQFIKGELDKAGVYYQPKTGIKKLREKFKKLNEETDG